MKLNPNADSFFPSPKPKHNPTSIELYHQGYVVVSSPSTLPPPPYYHQPCFYGGARGVHNLHPGTAIDGAKKQDDASKRFSKRGFLRHVITGYGRRLEARRTRGFQPPRLRCLARRPTGSAVCGPRIEEATLGNFTRVKKTKQPLAPVERERSTTIMIRNIPNRYTCSMLIDFLDNHCLIENRELADKEEEGEQTESAFDLVYLPIDFDTRMNKGYGFVNFTNPEAAWRFYVATNSQKWEFFQSNKVRDVVAARFQGKDNLVAHLNSMKFPAGWDEVLPVCFSPPRDGTIKGSQKTLGKLEISLCNNNNNNYFSGGGGGGSSRSRPTFQLKKKNALSPEVRHASSEEKGI